MSHYPFIGFPKITDKPYSLILGTLKDGGAHSDCGCHISTLNSYSCSALFLQFLCGCLELEKACHDMTLHSFLVWGRFALCPDHIAFWWKYPQIWWGFLATLLIQNAQVAAIVSHYCIEISFSYLASTILMTPWVTSRVLFGSWIMLLCWPSMPFQSWTQLKLDDLSLAKWFHQNQYLLFKNLKLFLNLSRYLYQGRGQTLVGLLLSNIFNNVRLHQVLPSSRIIKEFNYEFDPSMCFKSSTWHIPRL